MIKEIHSYIAICDNCKAEEAFQSTSCDHIRLPGGWKRMVFHIDGRKAPSFKYEICPDCIQEKLIAGWTSENDRPMTASGGISDVSVLA